MRRALTIALVCAGLGLTWGSGSALAGEPAVTPAPNTTQGEGALPSEQPRATPAPTPPARRHRDRRPKRHTAPPEASPTPAAAPPNVPLDPFRVPAFLLPIYRAAGERYAVPWPVLAAINEIETDYGRNVAVSSAGAIGWMQFMPESWQRYGVDADGDGDADPYDPVDAIHSAARYLRAAGAAGDLRAAVFAYNHADWYVDWVLERARAIGGLPADVVGAAATYRADAASDPEPIGPPSSERVDRVVARAGAAVVAVAAARVVRLGSERMWRFIELRDGAGNAFTYGYRGTLARTYPSRRRADAPPVVSARPRKRRLFAHPGRPRARAAGGARQLAELEPLPRLAGRPPLSRKDYVARRLVKGARLSAGTVLGRLAPTSDGSAPQVRFVIRPAGSGAPPVDLVPVLEGSRSLEGAAAGRLEPRPWARPSVRADRIRGAEVG
jgi:hypothetical protein